MAQLELRPRLIRDVTDDPRTILQLQDSSNFIVDALGNLDTLFVESALKEHRRHHRAAKLLNSVNANGYRTLMGVDRRSLYGDVGTHGLLSLLLQDKGLPRRIALSIDRSEHTPTVILRALPLSYASR
jgi:hypothetical protein